MAKYVLEALGRNAASWFVRFATSLVRFVTSDVRELIVELRDATWFCRFALPV